MTIPDAAIAKMRTHPCSETKNDVSATTETRKYRRVNASTRKGTLYPRVMDQMQVDALHETKTNMAAQTESSIPELGSLPDLYGEDLSDGSMDMSLSETQTTLQTNQSPTTARPRTRPQAEHDKNSDGSTPRTASTDGGKVTDGSSISDTTMDITVDESSLFDETQPMRKSTCEWDDGEIQIRGPKRHRKENTRNATQINEQRNPGHSHPSLIGTEGGGDNEQPWDGQPSTAAQKSLPRYALHTIVKKSTISGAGLGLFLQENAKKGERVARYSGKKLDAHEASISNSKYLFQVNKNLFLDAEDPRHTIGRYANCNTGHNNATFGAGRSATYDHIRKQWWISIYATKNIKAGDEILVPYSAAYKLPKNQISAAPAMAATPQSNEDKRTKDAAGKCELKPKNRKRCNLQQMADNTKGIAKAMVNKITQKASKAWDKTTEYITRATQAADQLYKQALAAVTTTDQDTKAAPKEKPQRRWEPILMGTVNLEGEPQLRSRITQKSEYQHPKHKRQQSKLQLEQNDSMVQKLVVETALKPDTTSTTPNDQHITWATKSKQAKIFRCDRLQYQPGLKMCARNKMPKHKTSWPSINKFIWATRARLRKEKLQRKTTTTNASIAINMAKKRQTSKPNNKEPT